MKLTNDNFDEWKEFVRINLKIEIEKIFQKKKLKIELREKKLKRILK